MLILVLTTMGIYSLNAFGKKLVHYRERAKLSLRDLSTISGVSHPTISGLEQGTVKPSKRVPERLATGLKLSGAEKREFLELVKQAPSIKRLKPDTKGLESSILIRAILLLTSISKDEIKEVWLQRAVPEEYDIVLKLKNRTVLGLKLGSSGEFWTAKDFSLEELAPPSRATQKMFVTKDAGS